MSDCCLYLLKRTNETQLASPTFYNRHQNVHRTSCYSQAFPGWLDVQFLVPLLKPATGVLALLFLLAVVIIVATPRFRVKVLELRNEVWLPAAAAFTVSLMPVAKLSVSMHNTENLRYLYMPTAFFVLTVVLASERLARSKPQFAAIGLWSLITFQAVSLHVLGWN